MKKFRREIKPAGFRVLIEPDATEEKTDSGIIIKRDEIQARSETKTGTIIDVGPTAWKAYDGGEPWAKVGDKVYFNPFSCKYVDVGDDRELVMVNDDDIQAVITKEELISE